MSKILERITQEAKRLYKHIVLPEGDEPRTVVAASFAANEKIAKITLIGDKDEIVAKYPEVDFSNVNFENPKTSKNLQKYTELLFELRKAKGMTMEKASEMAKDNLYFANLMLKSGDADGIVAGAVNSTSNVLRPALQIIKTAPGIASASSCFLMLFPEGSPAHQYGSNGAMIYGDCGVIPNPTAEQLADVAVASAKSCRSLIGAEPKVAMLAFSTKGSAKDPIVDKVIEGTKFLAAKNPDFVFDGELQGDAAIVQSVARQKAKGSPLDGQANVLIFPDLNAGNIAYKLSQRLSGGEAIGPIIQGLAKPINDLSRGCVWQEIVTSIAIVALKTQE